MRVRAGIKALVLAAGGAGMVAGMVAAQAEPAPSVAVSGMTPRLPDMPAPDPAPRLEPILAPRLEPASVSPLAPALSLRPAPRDTWAVPTARWDDHPEARAWTSAVLAALRGPGAALLQSEPRDIRAWCPGYLQADAAQRAAFWTGLVSALAWHESTHRPAAVGGGGQWFGLVQIAPGTARWRDCEVQSASALMEGPANLRCGIRIMATTVPRDNVVSDGMRGVAADWGPFHSRSKREDMRDWVSGQDYCQAPPPARRPVARPAGVGVGAGTDVAAPDVTGPIRPVLRP